MLTCYAQLHWKIQCILYPFSWLTRKLQNLFANYKMENFIISTIKSLKKLKIHSLNHVVRIKWTFHMPSWKKKVNSYWRACDHLAINLLNSDFSKTEKKRLLLKLFELTIGLLVFNPKYKKKRVRNFEFMVNKILIIYWL